MFSVTEIFIGSIASAEVRDGRTTIPLLTEVAGTGPSKTGWILSVKTTRPAETPWALAEFGHASARNERTSNNHRPTARIDDGQGLPNPPGLNG